MESAVPPALRLPKDDRLSSPDTETARDAEARAGAAAADGVLNGKVGRRPRRAPRRPPWSKVSWTAEEDAKLVALVRARHRQVGPAGQEARRSSGRQAPRERWLNHLRRRSTSRSGRRRRTRSSTRPSRGACPPAAPPPSPRNFAPQPPPNFRAPGPDPVQPPLPSQARHQVGGDRQAAARTHRQRDQEPVELQPAEARAPGGAHGAPPQAAEGAEARAKGRRRRSSPPRRRRTPPTCSSCGRPPRRSPSTSRAPPPSRRTPRRRPTCTPTPPSGRASARPARPPSRSTSRRRPRWARRPARAGSCIGGEVGRVFGGFAHFLDLAEERERQPRVGRGEAPVRRSISGDMSVESPLAVKGHSYSAVHALQSLSAGASLVDAKTFFD